MSAIFPDQEIDPLWYNTESLPRNPPLELANATGNDVGDLPVQVQPSADSILYSILVYAAVLVLVVLPLLPCCRCEDEDYTDSKRYKARRQEEIQDDIITKVRWLLPLVLDALMMATCSLCYCTVLYMHVIDSLALLMHVMKS